MGFYDGIRCIPVYQQNTSMWNLCFFDSVLRYQILQVITGPFLGLWELRIVTIGYSNTSISEPNVCM